MLVSTAACKVALWKRSTACRSRRVTLELAARLAEAADGANEALAVCCTNLSLSTRTCIARAERPGKAVDQSLKAYNLEALQCSRSAVFKFRTTSRAR